ncbi:hypothetical protein NI470_05290 [Acinetobacter lwoffii]|uniref:hypothetical protein n=1 Tax=Acinetobacter lwoffii TaxID=28090 RepID=UPI00209B4157|nr:hypothetical protein [Acinetobacter lwoffii]MCO8073161.1 hypothetical protein [Acinetobacter lwoffii]MCO8076024.1 hypothetical protein [Acinetobacter lwoffii]
MAVPEQTPYIEHTGNGATTSFALKFQCESKDHLIVLVDEIEPPIETWSLTGGNVVFTTAPAAGKKITLQRNTPFSRTTDYQSYNNSFRPPAVNKDFDWIWLKLQELGVADWILGARIDALKNYVDDRDDELRAYLMEEIRKQGVALDQLDEYYNYLMQRLAQIAVDKGWEASFVVDASGKTQQEINNSVIYQCDTVADLATIFPRGANHIVHVRRYSATSKWVGGQDYRWDAASTDAVNDFETIASPFSANGRWKAVFKNNVMNAWSLGYFGDGTTDNAARHKAVSKWMHENNETRKLIFSSGDFLFNGESGNFYLVSNTDYQIKPTAKIKGGSSFDDNGIYFGTSYDNNQYLTNVKVYGGGTFDMSGTGYMRTAYHIRTVIFIPKQDKVTFDGITFTGGDFVWSIVTGATLRESDQENCVIKNCTFDFHMVDMPDSKNSDFTAIYVNTPNATIRNNTFNAKSVRARMLGTAVEFHHHGGSLLNNTFNDVGVGTYIAQQEEVHTNDTIIQGNKGTCTGLFVAYWSDGGVQRYALRNSIIGNTIKQRNFPSSAEQSAIGLVPRSSGLSFIAFIHTDPTANQLPLITGGLTISGNSFTHSQVDAASTFINFISQAPHGISVIGNDLRVANLITTPSGRLSKPISRLTMRQNTINGEYLSSTTSPVSFRANSVTNCVIDLSDITYETLSNKNIPLISWDVVSNGNYLNTIIEGEYSYPTYSTVLYPADFFAGSNANTVSHVFSANINIPAATVAGAVLASVTVDIAINSKLRVLSASIGLESTLTLPVYLSRRSSALAYTGVGYTTQAIAAPTAISATFYTTRV